MIKVGHAELSKPTHTCAHTHHRETKNANMAVRTRLMFSLSLAISSSISGFQPPARETRPGSSGSEVHFSSLLRMLPPRANPGRLDTVLL